MTLRQFEYLSEFDQEFILRTKSVLIASMIDQEGSATLFQVDGFYLEIRNKFSRPGYTIANFFDDTELLEPYLEFINIEPVYSLLGYGRMH